MKHTSLWQVVHCYSTCTVGGDAADIKPQLQWYHFTGVLLFIYASYHQYKCHCILASIRTGRDSNTYGLPKGDWFELVTSPHYFAEILLYTGIAMVQGFKNVWTIAPVVSTVLVVLLGARLTHEWYSEKYKEECSNRRALVPYIYWFRIWCNLNVTLFLKLWNLKRKKKIESKRMQLWLRGAALQMPVRSSHMEDCSVCAIAWLQLTHVQLSVQTLKVHSHV